VNPVTVYDVAAWDKIWAVVHDVFAFVSVDVFASTYLGYFIILVLLVGVALFLWRWFKSI
jgi:hypothetical protein